MHVLSVAVVLIAIIGVISQMKEYCPDNLCTGEFYEHKEAEECISDYNCDYGRKCCYGCKYKICVDPIFKEHVVDNSEYVRDKYCPKVKPCFTPLIYNIRYRCGSDEVCPYGYKCCRSDCYIHRVCVAPIDKEGNEVVPPVTTTVVAITHPISTVVTSSKLPVTTTRSNKIDDKITSYTPLPSLETVTTVAQETSTESQETSHGIEFSGSGDGFTDSDDDGDDDDQENDTTTTQGFMSTNDFSKTSVTTLTTKSVKVPTTVQGTTGEPTEIVASGDGFTDNDDDNSDDGEGGSGYDNFTTTHIILSTSSPNFGKTFSTTKKGEISTTVQATTRATTDIDFGSGFTNDDDDSDDDGETGSGDHTFTTTQRIMSTSSVFSTTDGFTTKKEEIPTALQGTTRGSTDIAGSGGGFTDDDDDNNDDGEDGGGTGDDNIKTTQRPISTFSSLLTTTETEADLTTIMTEESTKFVGSSSRSSYATSRTPFITSATSTHTLTEDTGSGDGFTEDDQEVSNITDFEFSEDTTSAHSQQTYSSMKPRTTTSIPTLTSRDISSTLNDIEGSGFGVGFTDDETIETTKLIKRSTLLTTDGTRSSSAYADDKTFYVTSTKFASLTTNTVEGSGFSNDGDDEEQTGRSQKTSFASITSSDFDFYEDTNYTSSGQSSHEANLSTLSPKVTETESLVWFSSIAEISTTKKGNKTGKPHVVTTTSISDYATETSITTAQTSNVSDTNKLSSLSPPIIDTDDSSGFSDSDDEDFPSSSVIQSKQTTAKSTISSNADFLPTKLVFTNEDDGSGFSDDEDFNSPETTPFVYTAVPIKPEDTTITINSSTTATKATSKPSPATIITTRQEIAQTKDNGLAPSASTTTPKSEPITTVTKKLSAAEFKTTHVPDTLSTTTYRVTNADNDNQNTDASNNVFLNLDVQQELVASRTDSGFVQVQTTGNGSDFNGTATVGPNLLTISTSSTDTRFQQKAERESLFKKILNSLEAEPEDNIDSSGDGDIDDDYGLDDVEIIGDFDQTIKLLDKRLE